MSSPMMDVSGRDPGDEDRRPIFLGPWCENCGDAFDGPERECPRPSTGEAHKQCGRGRHMFRLEVEPRRVVRHPLVPRNSGVLLVPQ